MVDFGLWPDKEKTLTETMSRLGVRSSDIVENFVRSKGPGGQNVNKVSTCVYLKHIPTGIEVKCQKERSQALNRYMARQLLLKKIEALALKKISDEKKRKEKIRRLCRRRSRRAQLRILEAKRRQAQKKLLRRKVSEIE
jgi:protein subunit release factor B